MVGIELLSTWTGVTGTPEGSAMVDARVLVRGSLAETLWRLEALRQGSRRASEDETRERVVVVYVDGAGAYGMDAAADRGTHPLGERPAHPG